MKRLLFALLVSASIVAASAQTRGPVPGAPGGGMVQRAQVFGKIQPRLVAATTCIAGVKGVAPTITLTIAPPTTNADGSPVTGPLTYSIYQGASSGTEAKVLTGQTVTTFVITTGAGMVGGGSAYFYATASNPNGESAPSAELCKSFPTSPPSAPGLTGS